MRKLLVLIFCLIPILAYAGSATLTWTPPTTNTDGSPITDLSGYKIYFGKTQGGTYANNVTVTGASTVTTTISGLSPGDWYFVATALNTYGAESAYSNEVKKSVAVPVPNAPSNLR